MKKSNLLLISLLFLSSGCNFNDSSSSSLSSSSPSGSSTSSTIYNSSTYEIKDVKLRDLKFEPNEDNTAYYITKYLKFDKNIRLPEKYEGKNIIGIKEGAFSSSGGVEDIYFPDTYIDFNGLAFRDCKTIKNYYVNDSNSKFSSINGVLYLKDQKSLVAYPLGRKKVEIVKEGTESILDYAFYSCEAKEIVLPESLELIGVNAFGYSKRLQKINIPSKIEEIPNMAFDTCISLKDITFGNSVSKIGERAFWGCAEISNLNFPSSLRMIKKSAFESCSNIVNIIFNEGLEKIEHSAFAYCGYVKELNFPSSLREIGDYAFIQSTTIETLSFNEGLETLGEGAFYYNTSLKTVTIPASVRSIGYDCFTSSDSMLQEFIVSNDSEFFKAEQGVLFTKDGKELICYPADLTYVLGDTKYVVPNGVEVIRDHAFYNAIALTSVTLPSSVKKIKKAPFYMCSSLNELKYLGTMDEFKLIETEKEIFSSGSQEMEVPWNSTYSGMITHVICSDGILEIK